MPIKEKKSRINTIKGNKNPQGVFITHYVTSLTKGK